MDSPRFRIVGCCHGLLCLIRLRDGYENEYAISLCNPLTNLSWDIPLYGYDDPQMKRRRISFYGFGYDDIHDDYKVMIATGHDDSYNEYMYEVYSLRSKSWSRQKSLIQNRCSYIHPAGVCGYDGVLVNCALHWAIRSYEYDKSYILAFDLRTDKHRYIPLPQIVEKYYGLRLGVLNDGALVLSHGTYDHIDIWVMKDYGLNDSWIHIAIPNISYGEDLAPMAVFKGNDERKIIFHVCKEGKVLLYDLATHRVMKFITIPGHGGSHFYFPFVGSLHKSL